MFFTPREGSEISYKGFGLCLFTERIAGIGSGGGASSAKQWCMTNSSFFISFFPEIFNQSSDAFNFEVNNLINYLREDSLKTSSNNVSIPGLRKKNNKPPKNIDIPKKLLDELIELKSA